MSYVYNPTTGFAQWMAEMSFATRTNDPPHGLYGSMYGPREEYEVLRQQNMYEDQHRGEHSPAGFGSHHAHSFLNSSTSLPFPARVASLPVSPDRWDSQRDSATQERLDEYSDATADRHHSRWDSYAQHPDNADLRFREDRLAKRFAEIGPAAYIEGITIRDSLRDPRLSVPRLRTLVLDEPAPADDTYLEPSTARDGLSVPRSGPIFEVDYSQHTPARKLIHALDEHHRLDLRAEPGHRFDNVDDDVVTAYVNTRDYESPLEQGFRLIKGSKQPFSASDSWLIPISFLRLQHKFLEVVLPIDQETVADLNNDILRVLYIHFSTDSLGIPYSVSGASVAESCRRVLGELERRGFTEQLPRVVRLRGLSDQSPDRMSRGLDSHDTSPRSKLAKRSNASVDQNNRGVQTFAIGEIRTPKGRRDNRARRDALRGSASTPGHVLGEMSEKKKGKAPVTRDHEADSSDHLSAGSSSNTVLHEREASSSDDSTPSARGRVTPAETASHGGSCDSSEKIKVKADKTTSRHKSSVLSQKAHHEREW